MAVIGSIRDLKVPDRPLVAIGRGTIVQLGQGDYAEVLDDFWQTRHGAMGHYVRVCTVSYEQVRTGFGEERDVMMLEVVE